MITPEDLEELEDIDNALCEKNYFHFFKKTWKIVEPSTQLIVNWHHELIAEYLTACYERQIKKLIINIPPKSTKSTMATITFPCWIWTHSPEERFIFSSYSDGLSTKHANDRRTIVTSEWYKNVWDLGIDKDTEGEFRNSERGHFIATSLGGVGTGLGGNYLIIDDPHDAKKAESDKVRESDLETFRLKFVNRLDDKINGVIIIIMQRLHERDLSGCLLGEGGWEHLVLPAECEKKTIITFPISKKVIAREEGDVLDKLREPKSVLEGIKKDMGDRAYAGQYQQRPAPKEGSILKYDWFGRYSSVPEFERIITSWDMTFKDKRTSDFVAGGVWGIKGAFMYLLDIVYKRMGFLESISAMKRMIELYPKTNAHIVEDKANGTAIIEVLKREVMGIIPYNPEGSKQERVYAIEPVVQAGNILVPIKEIAKFDTDAYINNLATFPSSAHDDLVDMTTQAVLYIKNRSEPKLTFV